MACSSCGRRYKHTGTTMSKKSGGAKLPLQSSKKAVKGIIKQTPVVQKQPEKATIVPVVEIKNPDLPNISPLGNTDINSKPLVSEGADE